MPAPEHILHKIKLLQKLAASPNKNEADAATEMAAKLIVKYNVTPEELKSLVDKAPAYGEEEKLFQTSVIVTWMSQLALAISQKYDCQIVQEIISPIAEGDSHYNYYIYGDSQDVEIVKFVWAALSKKVEELITTSCASRGPIYVHSYTEGVVQSIKLNLQFDDLMLPLIKKDILVKKNDTEIKPDAIVSENKIEREKPTENKHRIESGIIKDIMAYFKGIEDGKNIHLQSVIDAHNASVKQADQEKETNEQPINAQTPSS